MRIDRPATVVSTAPRSTRERSFTTRSMPAKPRSFTDHKLCHAVRTRPPMATTTSCCTAASRRRLSDLLQEQQEPLLLLHHLLLQADDGATPARTPAPAATTRSLLRGTTRLARRWADDVLAGCFPRAAAAARQRLRRLLPRPGRDAASSCAQPADDGAAGGGCGRPQLSPVSVLDLLSHDESSTVPAHPGDDDGKPSTSGSGNSPSPPSIHDHDLDLPSKTPAVEAERRFQRKSAALFASACREWESVAVSLSLSLSLPHPLALALAADSSWIPSLQVERDLSGSPRDCWRRLVGGGRAGEQEARQVARSIEAMIFEEVRWEAVRDMLSLPPQP